MTPAITRVTMTDLEQLLERARTALGEADYQTLKAVVETLAYLTQVAEDKQTTIQHLRRLLFGGSTEKTRNVLVLLARLEEAASDPPAGADHTRELRPGSRPDSPAPPPALRGGESVASFGRMQSVDLWSEPSCAPPYPGAQIPRNFNTASNSGW